MNTPARVPLTAPDLRGNEAAYLNACVVENWVSSAGRFVGEMERRMATLIGRGHGVATVNGTAALHLALIAAGVEPGDRVLMPDWTFGATANAVYHAGAQPYFIDVTHATWTLDPDLVAQALADPANRIRAVIAVHALGHPADLDPIGDCCATAGVALIEDVAGALGARYRSRPAGAFGDLAVFSFNGNKTVTAGGGGMVVTDDGASARRMRRLSTQARSGHGYRHEEVGFNYRMTNLNAAVGLAQLERLDEMLAAKRAIAQAYDQALAGRSDLKPMPRAEWAESSCWLYSVLCGSPPDAEALVAHLDARAVEACVFWISLSAQAPFALAPRLLTGAAAALSGRVVSLPSSSGLGAGEQRRVIEALAAWQGSTDVEAIWTSS
ncbi:MAG: aminotransferase class I/II-fold pyridoxal phosphate-dependent enzyme [Kiloniellales bacterium]